jgi:hypothetical protein
MPGRFCLKSGAPHARPFLFEMLPGPAPGRFCLKLQRPVLLWRPVAVAAFTTTEREIRRPRLNRREDPTPDRRLHSARLHSSDYVAKKPFGTRVHYLASRL